MRLPRWAKIIVPVGAALLIAGIVLAAVAASRGPHVPSEADYRHGFEDIAAVVISNGGPWDAPAAFPAPLSSTDEELFAQVKTQLLDNTCSTLAKGEESSKQSIDLALALAKDNRDPLDYTLLTRQAVVEAAADYICPQYSGVANSVSGYINALLVLNS